MLTWVNKLKGLPFKWESPSVARGRDFFALLLLSFSLLVASCKSNHLPKTTENSRPVKSSAYKKYTAKLGFEVDRTCNLKLLDEVIDWWGTPYKYGGESKSGGCSGIHCLSNSRGNLLAG